MVHAVTVLVVTSDRFAAHDTGRRHPERGARLAATAAEKGAVYKPKRSHSAKVAVLWFIV